MTMSEGDLAVAEIAFVRRRSSSNSRRRPR